MRIDHHQTVRWLLLAAVLTLASCGGSKIYPSQTWVLPAKTSPDSAMIIGRIGMQNDKQRILSFVTIQRWGKVYSRCIFTAERCRGASLISSWTMTSSSSPT